jgi:PST family polysaccharide transporter
MERISIHMLFESRNREEDLSQQAIRGGINTVMAEAGQFVLRLVGTVVLARLLSPSDYGLIAMVSVIINFAMLFKDAGLSMATIQRAQISQDQISALFWLNLFVSMLLGLVVLASSPVVAWFYGRPELAPITAMLSMSFLVTGLTIQHQALLRRHMCFGMLAVIRVTSYATNVVVTILLAVLGWKYWSLVAGTLALGLSNTLMTLYFCPWVPGRWRRGMDIRDMFVFGGHLTGFNFINYFSRNLDNLLIGKFIGMDALGLYSRAYSLFMMPISQIRGPLTHVAMPVLSRLRDQPERYAKYYQRLVDVLASLTIPFTLYCVLEAEFLIELLLGPRWLGASPVFRILAIAGLIQPVAGTRGLVALSHGFSKRYLYWGLFNAILCTGSFVAGLPFGIAGIATAYTIMNYILLIPSLYYCFHMTPVTVSMFFRVLLAPFLCGVLAAVAVVGMKQMWVYESPVYHYAYAGVFTVVYAGMSLCRPTVREIVVLGLRKWTGWPFGNARQDMNIIKATL